MVIIQEPHLFLSAVFFLKAQMFSFQYKCIFGAYFILKYRKCIVEFKKGECYNQVVSEKHSLFCYPAVLPKNPIN